MATLQERNGSYRVLFYWNGKKRSFPVGAVSADEADGKLRNAEYLLMRLKQKLVALPAGVDVATFLEFDGQPPATLSLPEAPRQVATLTHLKERYLATLGNGTVEANTLATCRIHLGHFCRVLGPQTPASEINAATLQDYVNKRAEAKLSPVTIRKEMATLSGAWTWGTSNGLTSGAFPNKGLRYPKVDEKLPFMTRAEILRRLKAGGDEKELWESWYLEAHELPKFLDHVKAAATYPWIYPLVALAAHTGARRSEMLRAKIEDVDLGAGVFTIREKKRARGQRTSRRVPMSPFLIGVLKEWLAVHPGGHWLFAQGGKIERSRTRKELAKLAAVTHDEANDHFHRVVDKSDWKTMRGFHTLRHSFISACVAKGIDQRILMKWVGHCSEAMQARYTHIAPSISQDAIASVFGS